MGISYGFYNSYNHDRLYNAEQFGSMFDGLIADGVYAKYGNAFKVTPTNSMVVNVGTGRAWFNHTWTLNDSVLPLPNESHPSDLQYDRYDAIVLTVDKDRRVNTITYVVGTPAANPQKPAMTSTSTVHKYPIAYIKVPRNATKITAANIDYRVGTSDCPFITNIVAEAQTIDAYLADYKNKIQQDLDAKFAEIDQWRQTISTLLDDNAATNLGNAITEVRRDLNGLETKHDSDISDLNTQITNVSNDNVALHQADTEMNTTLTQLKRYFSTGLTVYSGTSYNINEVPETFCRILNTCNGTLPTGLGGNQYSVYTQVPGKQTNPAYNVQVAVGFGADKIAIRRRNGGNWTAWKYVALK